MSHHHWHGGIIAPDGALLTPEEAQTGPVATRGDPSLVKALARAHRWRGLLEGGIYATVRDMAKAEKVNETYICRVLRLTMLAPDMVEAILEGRQPEGMTLPRLMEGVAVVWSTPSQSACAQASLVDAEKDTLGR